MITSIKVNEVLNPMDQYLLIKFNVHPMPLGRYRIQICEFRLWVLSFVLWPVACVVSLFTKKIIISKCFLKNCKISRGHAKILA